MHLKQGMLAGSSYLTTVKLCMHRCIISHLPPGKPISFHFDWRVAQLGQDVCACDTFHRGINYIRLLRPPVVL